MTQSLPQFLATWARREPDAVAVSDPTRSLTWAELDRRVTAVAAWLRRFSFDGVRAAILADEGVDWVVGFLATLRAGLVAVPAFAPGRDDAWLTATITDAAPEIVLTTGEKLLDVRALLDTAGVEVWRIVAIDSVPAEESGLAEPDPAGDACLCYTSDSVGVVLTHAGLVDSAARTAEALRLGDRAAVVVNWLPLCQLGLPLAVAAPVFAGCPVVHLPPEEVRERPEIWLRALEAHPGAVTAAANSFLARCPVPEGLDLSGVRALLDVGEPARYRAVLPGSGLRPDAHRAAYGLLEATGLVSVGDGPMSSGRPGRTVVIADPRTRRSLPAGVVGEIWVTGPTVARGYWRRPAASAETFCALLRDDAEAGEPGWWLRTGDAGFLSGGELTVLGRLANRFRAGDAEIQAETVEATVERVVPELLPGSVIVFPVAEGEVVVLAESDGPFAGAVAIEQAVADGFELRVRDVHVGSPGWLPRTVAGKPARGACRDAYLAGIPAAP
ncbi:MULTISPECIES: AMP-binding protein [Amycolatopsis]|uniref:AMP-binding protein n=1 Tax=Amycolatopsis TaxID=1813 RepID=UPI000B8B4F2A|nr:MULTISPECIES: AMP-binding protein [Amycolatopsis]OXM67443.1 fatty-acid--CoA ligase [Amycolatopsis sp. KNN50.9b]